MIIMKKMLAMLVVSLIIFVISGCGKNEIQNRKSQSLSKEEIVNFDLAEKGIARVRSIDEICIHAAPLVYKENVYDESGELIQYIQYEYDEYNRYKTIYNYQKNPQSSEMVLFLQEDLSYDEYFYYRNTTYVQAGGLVTQDIYDTHNNIVMTQIPNKYFDDVSTLTYTYKYPTDTDKIEEEYTYRGEKAVFSHYTIRQFNEYGDLVYIMTQYDDSISTKTYEYQYDREGHMTSKYETYIDQGLYGEDKSSSKTIYIYDDQGRLISEKEDYVLNEGTYFGINASEIRKFEYDNMGRLVKKTIWHKTERNDSEFDESTYSVEYIYEPENSESGIIPEA